MSHDDRLVSRILNALYVLAPAVLYRLFINAGDLKHRLSQTESV